MTSSPASVEDHDPLLRAARLVRAGGVVACPTETLYGLAADPFNPSAVDRLIALKGRGEASPFLLLLGRAAEAHDLANLKGEMLRRFKLLSAAFWPGPLTLILPARSGLRCPALRGGATVAVRISPHPIARQLALHAGGPITSTSANRSGQPAAATAGTLDPAIVAGVDLVLEGGPAPGGAPSTLLDLTVEPPRVVRGGAIAAGILERALGLTLAAAEKPTL